MSKVNIVNRTVCQQGGNPVPVATAPVATTGTAKVQADAKVQASVKQEGKVQAEGKVRQEVGSESAAKQNAKAKARAAAKAQSNVQCKATLDSCVQKCSPAWGCVNTCVKEFTNCLNPNLKNKRA